MSYRGEPDAPWAASRPERIADRSAVSRTVVLRVDYGMAGHGLAPLFIDGRATEVTAWGFSSDIVRRLRRLSELHDRQVNWDDPADPTWRISERDRNEFNALLPFVAAELQMALGDGWRVVIESEPI